MGTVCFIYCVFLLDYARSTVAPASSSFSWHHWQHLFQPVQVQHHRLFQPWSWLRQPETGQLANRLNDLDLFGPVSLMTTSNSVFASASSTAAGATPAAATATGAAAETPQVSSSFVTSSAASITLSLPNSSTNLSN